MLNDRHFQIRFRTLKLHYDSLINSSLNQKSVQWLKESACFGKNDHFMYFCQRGMVTPELIFLNVGKIQATDSNDSLRPEEFNAKRIFVRRCTNWS